VINDKDDKFILEQIEKGQKEAFMSLYSKYKSRVFGLARRIMPSLTQAEDVTQEVWVKIVKSSGQFKGSKSAHSWILAITKNTCLDYLRQSPEWQKLVYDEDKLASDNESDNIDFDIKSKSSGSIGNSTAAAAVTKNTGYDSEANFKIQENIFDTIDESSHEALKMCIDQLTLLQRAAIVLFYFEEKTISQLSFELSLKVNAVKAQLFRARGALYKCINHKLSSKAVGI